MFRRGLGVAGVASAVIVGLGVVPAQTATAAPHPTVAASICSKAVFVGVAGSGELKNPSEAAKSANLGKTIAGVRDRLQSQAQVPMLTAGINYTAAGVETLAPGIPEQALLARGDVPDALATFAVLRARPFQTSIGDGVTKTVSYLNAVGAGCGNVRPIVLAGYSQGAMVLHRTLERLAATPRGRAILARVVGIVLLADGDRVSATAAPLIGRPPASGSGQGIASWLHMNARRDVLASMQARTVNVCTAGDFVCDFRGASSIGSFSNGFKVHTSYPSATTPGSSLAQATDGIASRLRGQMPSPPLASVPPGQSLWLVSNHPGETHWNVVGVILRRGDNFCYGLAGPWDGYDYRGLISPAAGGSATIRGVLRSHVSTQLDYTVRGGPTTLSLTSSSRQRPSFGGKATWTRLSPQQARAQLQRVRPEVNPTQLLQWATPSNC